MAVCFPLKTRLVCTKRNALVGIVCVYLGLLIFNGFWDFATKIINGVCKHVPIYAVPELATLTKAYLVVGTFVYCLLPVAIMLILTPMTVVQLVRQSKLRKSLSSSSTISDETAKMTTMLVGITIAFMVLVAPTAIAHNVSFATGENIFRTKNVGMVIAREILQVIFVSTGARIDIIQVLTSVEVDP